MIDPEIFSLLYWDLGKLPSMDLQVLLNKVEALTQIVPFKQVLIVANKSIIPAKIEQVARRPLYADLYIPAIRLRDISTNTVHRNRFVDVDTLKQNIWGREQLISIGHKIDDAISIGSGPEFDISYQTFVEDLDQLFIHNRRR